MSQTFVLIHGAWHGAWCWAAVMTQLEKLGDRAYALDLPGHGQNYTNRAAVTLDTYVDYVVRFIEDRDLRDVILAGHSLGGLTIAGVTARIPQRIKRTVFVSAIVPLDGEMIIDPANPASAAMAQMINAAPDRSWELSALGPDFYAGLMSDVPPAMREFVDAAVCPEPGEPPMHRAPMAAFHASGVPTGYLVCENDQTPIAGVSGWHPHFSSRLKNPALKFINCGHEVMLTHPVECARALHEFALM